jgi:hypothetical protein
MAILEGAIAKLPSSVEAPGQHFATAQRVNQESERQTFELLRKSASRFTG